MTANMRANLLLLSDNTSLPEDLEIDKSKNYGTLTINTPEGSNLTKTYHMVINIDRSASMEGTTPSDNTTKLKQVCHISCNIIEWMKNNNNTFYITIIIFDYEATSLVEYVCVNKDTASTLIDKINSIKSRGTTNLEAASKKAAEVIKLHNDPAIENIHIFMTDGIPTEGLGRVNRHEYSKRVEEHNKLVNYFKYLNNNNIYKEYIIGFGSDHDSGLLEQLAGIYNEQYHFIDCLETCGMVYGEILHAIIYKFLDEYTLNCENFKVYNYKTNSWDSTYKLTNLTYDSTKTYIICSNDLPNLVDNNKIELIINYESSSQDINNYLWRQKTLEFLYIQKTNSSVVEINTFLEKLKKYIHLTNQENNAFLKVLCDDLFVAVTVNNHKEKKMYIASRQSSQGDQRGYTTKNIEHLINKDDWDNISGHELSQTSDTPFTNKSKTSIYRSVSAPSNNSSDSFHDLEVSPDITMKAPPPIRHNILPPPTLGRPSIIIPPSNSN